MAGIFAQGCVRVQPQEHFQAGVFLNSLNENGPRPLEQLHHTERLCTRHKMGPEEYLSVSPWGQGRALMGNSQHSRCHTNTPSTPVEDTLPITASG